LVGSIPPYHMLPKIGFKIRFTHKKLE